ncbi:peptidase family m1 domain-containing protein [Ditylenchus destructor]|uniref:Aminopeptidase n=1 Tax=Ditylenchus destructor TaxID=166010 RepID=A0AAD4MN92_9BILA|nr:peptidase family m1 domain-containing protein [Ditylenchus destructor]
MPTKRNVISISVGGIAIALLAAGAVSYFLWGSSDSSAPNIVGSDKSPMSILRLSTDLRPIWYNLSITAYVPGFIYFEEPTKSQTFEANVTIKVHSDNPTYRIELNARELNFTNVTVTADAGDIIQITSVEVQKNLSKVVFNLNRKLEAGRNYYIQILYSGLIGDRRFGLYIASYDTKDGRTKYLATTNMEPAGARLLVPCFDEPSFKAIWKVQITHPKGTNAIFNAMEEEQNLPVSESGNWLSTRFSETPPMSSYLLAVVVSDFAYKESTMKSIDGNDIRVRVWLRSEIIEDGIWALESAMAILAIFERRFKIPFPISKMDLVGVTSFRWIATGAMENFGLVTFYEKSILFNSTVDTASTKISVADIIAHEFAHQWFGDIVTLNWWSNLFLNEGFATLMVDTALADMSNISPTQNIIEAIKMHEIGNMRAGFASDMFSTSHSLYYDFLGPEEMGTIFDGISFKKGSSILHMIETVIGSEVFYRGLCIYLKRHSFGNVGYMDLLTALDEAVQTNSTMMKGMSVKDFAKDWITQANHPIVVANFEINGAKIKSAWKIPIWYQLNGEDKDMFWLENQAIILENVGNDDLLIINPKSVGFYHVQYREGLLDRINKELITNHTSISPLARGRILDDAFWLAHAGYTTYDVAFNLTTYLSRERDSWPWLSLMYQLDTIAYFLNGEPESKIADEFVSLMNEMRNTATSLSLLSARTPFLAENKAIPLPPFATNHEEYYDDYNRNRDLPYLQRNSKNVKGVTDEFLRPLPVELASENGLEMWLKTIREEFLERCSSTSEAISSQCSKVATNFRNYAYCLGVKYEIIDFDFMIGMYEREVNKKEKNSLLYSLCCTQNAIGMKRLLRAVVHESAKPVIPVIYADDVVINVARNSAAGQYIAFDFFLDNWQLIYYRFVNEDDFGILNTIIRTCLFASSPRAIKTLESFLNDPSNDLHAVQELNRTLTFLKTKRHWIEKNLKPLSNSFNIQIARAKEKPKTR